MTVSYSQFKCKACNKKLLTGLYIGLTDNTHKHFIRYCYECQKYFFGLNFWKIKKSQTKCLHCNLDLYKNNLFEEKSYYIFTDMSDSSQIAFCKVCFEAASPK